MRAHHHVAQHALASADAQADARDDLEETFLRQHDDGVDGRSFDDALGIGAVQGFSQQRDGSGMIQRTVAALVVVGSLVVGVISIASKPGSERGRKAFVAEIQAAYTDAPVRVYANDLQLVIESTSDPDAAIDAAAAQLGSQIASHGKNAKAWVVGFESIVITNGRHQRLLRPSL